MISLFGGTFSPIHQGHIQLAQQVLEHFALQRIEFVPCHIPVHRDQPQVTPQLRKTMVELAIRVNDRFVLNSIELERGGLSYAYDTLSELKRRQPQAQICWLMGGDSFNSFSTWKKPQQILELAHLIVCTRPGVKIDEQQFTRHYLSEGEKLNDFPAGKIVFYPMQPNPCSSTRIRQQLKNGESVADCLTQPVLNFIQQNHLYE